MAESDYQALHRDAIVIDAACPLLRRHQYVDWFIEGGLTAAAPTLGTMPNSARQGLAAIGEWVKYVRDNPALTLVHGAADIEAAKRQGRLGLILHFQGADPIEDDLDLVDGYGAAGLRILQLCYNVRNRFGDGADERTDSGLSYLGQKLIERLNAARIVVDCAHTGERTSMDAIEASSAPVVITHANAKGVHDSPRNISDELIQAIAAQGGVVGTVGFPAFLGTSTRPTLDDFIADIDYKVALVGIDHVGLGIDYYDGQHPVADAEDAEARYRERVESGRWRPSSYPPPPYYFPEGIGTPRELANLTKRLLERGYGEADVRKILGLNWLRVFGEIWGGQE
jgi:membrane dipeptidase